MEQFQKMCEKVGLDCFGVDASELTGKVFHPSCKTEGHK